MSGCTLPPVGAAVDRTDAGHDGRPVDRSDQRIPGRSGGRGDSVVVRSRSGPLDSEIGGLLGGLSDRQARATAARIAYRLDPQAAVDRTHAAESARRVTFRPAPDTMAIMAALVPARDGVAMFAALDRAAKTAKAAGDHRTRGQIMADTLLARVTGTESVEDLPIEIRLVITDGTLFAGGSMPARMEGYDGPIPAPTARRLALGDDTTTAKRRLRRVYTRDETIIGMDHRARHFTGNLRDQHCRTPYCDAPIRHIDHIDHIVPHHDNGPTTTGNGQGLCAGCNYLKEHPDWTTTVSNNDEPGRPHTTHITTPTGHHHQSTAPPPLGIGARRKRRPHNDSHGNHPPDDSATATAQPTARAASRG